VADGTCDADVSSLEDFLATWELQQYLSDFRSIGCVDVHGLTTLLWSSSATAFTPVLERMKKPEYKRLLRVLRSMVGPSWDVVKPTGDTRHDALFG
jgi:hypothetical protein